MMRHTFAAVIQWQACHGERCGNGSVGALAMLTWHNQVLEGTQATPVTLNTAQVAGKGRDSCGTRGSHVNNNAFTCRLFKTHPMCVTYRCSVWTRIFDVPDKRVVLTPHCSRVLHHGHRTPQIAFPSVGYHASPTPAPQLLRIVSRAKRAAIVRPPCAVQH